MISRLIVLIKMQLSEKIKIDRTNNRNIKLAKIGKMIVAMAISYGIFVGAFFVIFNLLFFRASLYLFTFVLFLMQAISIVTCTVGMSDMLYLSKDNSLLMMYPVKHVVVYISKLCVSYILQLRKSVIFTFPLIMAFGTIVSDVISVNYILSSMIFSLFLPLFPVLIGVILSIPLVYSSKLLKKYNIAKVVLTIIVFAIMTFFTYKIVNALPDSIRIVALYRTFLNNCDKVFMSVDQYTLYIFCIGKVLFGIEIIKNYLMIFIMLIVLACVSIVLSLFLFFRLESEQSEHSIQKTHKAKNHVSNSPMKTFLRKELTLSIRNISDFISDYLFLFLMPFVLIIISAVYIRVDRNALGVVMTYSFIGFITILMLAASNTSSSTALSSEGNEFVLLKTSPYDSKAILYSKLLVNFVVSFITLTLSYIALSIVLKDSVDLVILWAVYFGVLIIDLGLMLWSIQLDVLNPRFRDYANSKNRSEIVNYSTSLVVGCVCAVIYSFIMILLFISNISMATSCLLVIAIAIIFTLVRWYFLRNYVNAYFDDIQL